MAYAGFLRTLPAPASTLGGFVCLLDTTWFTQADSNALDGTTFINGGGSLRLYTDATKATQLPVDVVSFVTGGTPEVKVFTRLPSYASGETIWIESDATATSQPVATSTYGSESVWQDYDMFTLDGVTDRSGNKTFTSTDMATTASDSPIGGNVADFNGTSSWFGHTQTGTSTDTSPFTIKAWIKPVSATNQAGIAIAEAFLRNYGYGLRTDSKIRGEIFYSGSSRNVDSTNTRTANAWNYTAYTYEGNTQQNVYLNGVYSTGTSNGRHFRRDVDLRWGKRADYSNSNIRGWFDGEMSGMGVLKSNNELIQDDFDSEYANQNSPSTFGSSSGWTTGGGGGVSGISAFDIAKPTFSATGSATLPNPIGSVSFDVAKPLFSSNGSSTLPQPIGSVSFDINNPTFSASGAATLPNPTGSVSFDIDKPIFSGAGSATLPQPVGAVSFNIDKPLFSSNGSSTLPNPTGSVSFTINAPTFASTGSATQTGNVGDAAFTVDSPIFSASGTATLPQPIGAVSFAIDSPVFSATGTVSGLVQNYADDAIVTIRYGKNTEIISYGKNIVIVTSGNNIVKL